MKVVRFDDEETGIFGNVNPLMRCVGGKQVGGGKTFNGPDVGFAGDVQLIFEQRDDGQ